MLGLYFDAKRKRLSQTETAEFINKQLEKRRAQYDILHLDIGDGKFIEAKTLPPTLVRKLKEDHKREAHLMVVNYKKFIKDYYLLADMFIVHNEVLRSDFQKTIDFLAKNHKFVGISISPKTRVDDIKYLDQINMILVMSVEPGLPGQQFMEQSLRKVRKLKEIRKKKGLSFAIAIDGGINQKNMRQCELAGADIVVMGSAFFK